MSPLAHRAVTARGRPRSCWPETLTPALLAGTTLPSKEAFVSNTEDVSVGAQTCREDQSAWALAPEVEKLTLCLCGVLAQRVHCDVLVQTAIRT